MDDIQEYIVVFSRKYSYTVYREFSRVVGHGDGLSENIRTFSHRRRIRNKEQAIHFANQVADFYSLPLLIIDKYGRLEYRRTADRSEIYRAPTEYPGAMWGIDIKH